MIAPPAKVLTPTLRLLPTASNPSPRRKTTPDPFQVRTGARLSRMLESVAPDPDASDRQVHEKAHFIGEHEVSALAIPLFLFSTSHGQSGSRSPKCRDRGLGLDTRLIDHYILFEPGATEESWGDLIRVGEAGIEASALLMPLEVQAAARVLGSGDDPRRHASTTGPIAAILICAPVAAAA